MHRKKKLFLQIRIYTEKWFILSVNVNVDEC